MILISNFEITNNPYRISMASGSADKNNGEKDGVGVWVSSGIWIDKITKIRK